MELAHSVNPSHWEVNYKQVMYGHVYILIFPKSTGIPQLVTVTPVNCTTVAVSWSEVQCFNVSGAVTHYLVQYQSMHGRAVQNTVTDGPVNETTVSGLTPDASLYTFRVAAVNNQTTGPFSNFVDLATAEGMQGDFECSCLVYVIFNFNYTTHIPTDGPGNVMYHVHTRDNSPSTCVSNEM